MMKNKFPFLIQLFLLLIFLTGCVGQHNKAIDSAYAIVNDYPDSALATLNHINKHRLATKELARYALVYTIAQDKSGLDVDNDSLLLKAYSYYDKRPTDTLYAKFQYYIGKYYMLNNRSEQAINCFKKAIASSKNNGDKYTQSLALEKLSKVIRTYSPLKAVAAAKEAAAIFSTLDDGSIDNMSRINTIYYKLNLSETLLFMNIRNHPDQ